MSKLTTEERNAILSARAKNRKAATALLNAGVELPKAQAARMKALDDYFNKLLAPAKAPAKGKKAA